MYIPLGYNSSSVLLFLLIYDIINLLFQNRSLSNTSTLRLKRQQSHKVRILQNLERNFAIDRYFELCFSLHAKEKGVKCKNSSFCHPRFPYICSPPSPLNGNSLGTLFSFNVRCPPPVPSPPPPPLGIPALTPFLA